MKGLVFFKDGHTEEIVNYEKVDKDIYFELPLLDTHESPKSDSDISSAKSPQAITLSH